MINHTFKNNLNIFTFLGEMNVTKYQQQMKGLIHIMTIRSIALH